MLEAFKANDVEFGNASIANRQIVTNAMVLRSRALFVIKPPLQLRRPIRLFWNVSHISRYY